MIQDVEFRGASKSTRFCFGLIMYLIAYNGRVITLPNGKKWKLDEDVIIIASETNMFAADNWVTPLRSQLTSNSLFKMYFGYMKPVARSAEAESKTFRKDAFSFSKAALSFPYQGQSGTVVGRGAGQQIRGMNIDGRPTTIVFDDIYSKNNIKTEESRQNIRYWVNAETINTLDANKGKAVLVGTMIHEDTVFVDKLNSSLWHCIEYPIMDKNKFLEALTKYCTVDRKMRRVTIPTPGECEWLRQNGYTTNWDAKLPIQFLLEKFQDAIETRSESMFWQEYFHEIVSEQDKKFKPTMFSRKKYDLVYAMVNGTKVYYVRIEHSNTQGRVMYEYRNVNIYVGVDAAYSDNPEADDTAIVCILVDWNNEIYVMRTIFGKMGMRDIIKPEFQHLYEKRSILCKNTTHLESIGMVDQVFRSFGAIDNLDVIWETNVAGKSSVKQFRSAVRDYGYRWRVYDFNSEGNKTERITTILLPYYETKAAHHLKGMDKLEHQLEMLSKGRNDDLPDAESICVAKATTPTKIPFPHFNTNRRNGSVRRRGVPTNQINDIDIWKLR